MHLPHLEKLDSIYGKGKAEKIVGDPMLLNKVPTTDENANEESERICKVKNRS